MGFLDKMTSDDQFVDLESQKDNAPPPQLDGEEGQENKDAVDNQQITLGLDNQQEQQQMMNSTPPPSASISNNAVVVAVQSPSATGKDNSVVIRSNHSKNNDSDNILSGFHVNYTWNNIPGEVLVEMFLWLDQKTLSEASLVNRDWYESSKHDLLWYSNCVELFKKIYSEQINYYVSERTRISYMKPYGKPIPPPPHPPKGLLIFEFLDLLK